MDKLDVKLNIVCNNFVIFFCIRPSSSTSPLPPPRLLAGSGGASNSRFAPQALSAAGADKAPTTARPKAAWVCVFCSKLHTQRKSGTETQSHVDEKNLRTGPQRHVQGMASTPRRLPDTGAEEGHRT